MFQSILIRYCNTDPLTIYIHTRYHTLESTLHYTIFESIYLLHLHIPTYVYVGMYVCILFIFIIGR